jgi:hypothetical protein
MPRPDAYSREDWATLIDDCGKFLDQWARQCSMLGWTMADLFQVHMSAPQIRHDLKGLIPLLRGNRIIDITRDTATLETSTGARQTFTRKSPSPDGPKGPIWELK